MAGHLGVVGWVVMCFGMYSIAESTYYMSNQGQSCTDFCHSIKKNCNPQIETNNTVDLFTQLGINCRTAATGEKYTSSDQPNYVSDPKSLDYKKCLGYVDVPGGVYCGASYPTVQRLCKCDDPSVNDLTFGFGYSQGVVTPTETTLYQHWLASGQYGAMTHFWMTIPDGNEKDLIVRYYVDEEEEASIAFSPAMACGVGFDDSQAPWGTIWFGKGALDAAWFWNFRVPFSSSIRVTIQHPNTCWSLYMIVRGGANIPLNFLGVQLPQTSRLRQFIVEGTYDALDFVEMVNVPSGNGMHFMSTLMVESGNWNFLEGCFHMYTNTYTKFPGIVLSTGTEDYYDSGWYFNAGEFHMPVSGYTHNGNDNDLAQWSAYRFHESDPIMFSDGFRLVWRNGEMYDASGIKCMIESGGTLNGSPMASNVTSYSWVYTW
ncbi:DUF2961 domain-containing protein [Pelomyxa schiedti]|nr:DUF2961 domain-containing protein [Pelomyxa schiedti]